MSSKLMTKTRKNVKYTWKIMFCTAHGHTHTYMTENRPAIWSVIVSGNSRLEGWRNHVKSQIMLLRCSDFMENYLKENWLRLRNFSWLSVMSVCMSFHHTVESGTDRNGKMWKKSIITLIYVCTRRCVVSFIHENV